MSTDLILTLRIPDIRAVVKSPEDLRSWVTTSLSEALITRLEALKKMDDDIQQSTRTLVIDSPAVDLRGIGITAGGMREF